MTSLGPTRNQLISKGMVWRSEPRRYGIHRAVIREFHASHYAPVDDWME